MIKAVFKYNEENGEISLAIKGHAGYSGVGYDIVCASATILAYTVAQYITIMHEQNSLQAEPVVRLGEGDILIKCIPNADSVDEALHTYLVAQVGFALLATNYSKYVRCRKFDGDSVKRRKK